MSGDSAIAGRRRKTGLLAIWLCAAAIVSGQQAGPGQAVRERFSKVQQHLAEGRLPEAEAELRKIIELAPDNPGVHANLGVVCFRQGRYGDAAASFRKALELNPSLAQAELFLGLSEAARGNLDRALPHIEKGFWNSPDDEWRRRAGLMLIEQHYTRLQHGEALRVLREMRKAFPGDPDVLYTAYRIHSDLGAKAVSELVTSAPGSARVHQVTAELYEGNEDFPAAVERYRIAIAADPDAPGLHRALGVALMNSDPDEAGRREAERHFRRELELNPRDAPSEYQLGELAWRRNESDAALAHYLRAVELNPNFPEALLAAAKVWIARDEPWKALDYLNRAAEIAPDNEVVHYRRAQAYRMAGEREAAREALAEFRRIREARDAVGSVFQRLRREAATPQTVDPQQEAQ